MVHGKNRIPYWIDRRLTGLAGPDYAATISFGLPFEPEDSQYGKYRLAGVGEDISFDIALIGRYGCKVYAFDPTPRAIDFIYRIGALLDDSYDFWPVGLWHSNGTQRFYVPENPAFVSHSIVNLKRTQDYFEAKCKTLANLMAELSHDHIDLLKLDIEGAEYGVLFDMLERGLDVGIICVDFDQPYPFRETITLIRRMKTAGYAVVAIDGWDVTFVRRSLSNLFLERCTGSVLLCE